MQGKKSFVLYTDLIELVNELTLEQRGKLLTIILEYVNDLDPEINDPLLRVAFTPIKQALKRDLKKWESIVDRNRENGAKGGRPPKNPEKPKKPSGLIGNPEKPKKPDNVNDSVTDIEKDIDTSKISLTRFHFFLKSENYLKELQNKGLVLDDIQRGIIRFCDLNSEKVFDSPDHLKNTFLKFLNAKSRVNYQKSPNQYEKLLKSIYEAPDYHMRVINEYGVSLEDWTLEIADNWVDWMKANKPTIENENHVFNSLREYLQTNFQELNTTS